MSKVGGISTIIDKPVETFVDDLANVRRLGMAKKMAEGDHEFTEAEIYRAIKDAEDEIIEMCECEDLALDGPMMRMIAQAQLSNTLVGHEENE